MDLAHFRMLIHEFLKKDPDIVPKEAIDVVPDEVIWTVNWLHYLNYEPIARNSSTRHLVCTRNNLGQTISSYGWCNGIPCVVPFFRSFSEQFSSNRLYYQRQESLPRVGLVFSAFRERFRVWPSFLRTGFHVPSPSYVLRYCFGICVFVRMYDISTPLQNSTVLTDCYLKLIKILCTNGTMLCSLQPIPLQSRQSIQ